MWLNNTLQVVTWWSDSVLRVKPQACYLLPPETLKAAHGIQSLNSLLRFIIEKER
jgi:hypothetical protein